MVKPRVPWVCAPHQSSGTGGTSFADVTDGSGISFTSGQNLAGDRVGKYADQVWIGGAQLRQVSTKAAVVAGESAG